MRSATLTHDSQGELGLGELGEATTSDGFKGWGWEISCPYYKRFPSTFFPHK